MAKIEIIDEAVAVKLSELNPGEVFQRDGYIYMMCYVEKPNSNAGTIRRDFYNASIGKNSDVVTNDIYVYVNLQSGELEMETIDYLVNRAEAKLSVNRVREYAET